RPLCILEDSRHLRWEVGPPVRRNGAIAFLPLGSILFRLGRKNEICHFRSALPTAGVGCFLPIAASECVWNVWKFLNLGKRLDLGVLFPCSSYPFSESCHALLVNAWLKPHKVPQPLLQVYV